jgi:SAM-dependent methyltransferase
MPISKKQYEDIVGKRIRYDILFKYETATRLIRKYKKGKLKILDIGCGQGIFAFFADKNWSLFGVDSDKDRIERAKKIKRKNTRFLLGDVENFRLREKVDVVLALDIIEHLDHPEKCIRLVSKYLKNDGVFIVSNPNRYSVWNVMNNIVHLEDHKHYWSPNQFGKMAGKSGFAMVDVIPRPLFSEGIGWAMDDYRRFLNIDKKLGSLLPKICTGWFLVFRKT